MKLSELEIELVDLLCNTPVTDQDLVAIVLALNQPQMQIEMTEWLKNNTNVTVSDILGTTMDIRLRNQRDH